MLTKLKELHNGGDEEGFTLIELMIVVVIIGILAAIAIPIFMNQQKSAIIAGVKSDVKNTNTNVATALVKTPTAAVIIGIANGATAKDGGKAGPTGTNAGTATSATVSSFDIIVTDAQTTLSVSGKWDAYSVTGKNDSVDSTKAVTYTSADGKLVSTF